MRSQQISGSSTECTRKRKLKTPKSSLSTYVFQAAFGKEGTSDEQSALDKSTQTFLFSKRQKDNIVGYEAVTIKF